MSKYKYTGPAGIDFYVFKDQTQTLHMKSFGEINPRTTMAHVSNRLRKYLNASVKVAGFLKNARDLKSSGYNTWSDFYSEAKLKHPYCEKQKWISGILFHRDPYTNNHSQSILAIGEQTIDYINSQI